MSLSNKINDAYIEILKANGSIVNYLIDNYLAKLGYNDPIDAIYYLADNLSTFTLLISEADYFNKDISDLVIHNLLNKEYDELFDIVLHEWEYAFINVLIKDKENKDNTIQILVPYRNSILDVMLSIQASLGIKENNTIFLSKAKQAKYTSDINDNDSLYADDYFTFELLYLKNSNLAIANIDKAYTVTIKKSEYIESISHYNNVILKSSFENEDILKKTIESNYVMLKSLHTINILKNNNN